MKARTFVGVDQKDEVTHSWEVVGKLSAHRTRIPKRFAVLEEEDAIECGNS